MTQFLSSLNHSIINICFKNWEFFHSIVHTSLYTNFVAISHTFRINFPKYIVAYQLNLIPQQTRFNLFGAPSWLIARFVHFQSPFYRRNVAVIMNFQYLI